ncbi:MAG TPA: flagellar basal body-associated FliL family protein [Steroidobacteraceae bacterium]|jgi:flagellar basal body-associated protein FliL|nr:flagellar basal body-associated FliL family protein [Steroidobacteraceae bacterium]
MADAADETSPPPPQNSGGLMGTLMNGIGVFVLTLAAVVTGGFVNAKLHPLPDMQLDKDGKIKAIIPVAAVSHGEDGGSGKAALYYAIDPPLVVNFEDGSVVRFLQITMEVMAREQKAIDSVQRNIPLIRNNLLLLMSNRNYQSMMSREGKEKLRQEALTEIRAVQKKEGSPDVDDLLFTSFVVQ